MRRAGYKPGNRKIILFDLEVKMSAYKITFSDGSSYVTSANGTLEEFTAYIMQFGGVVVDENPVTGEETKRQIVKVDLEVIP